MWYVNVLENNPRGKQSDNPVNPDTELGRLDLVTEWEEKGLQGSLGGEQGKSPRTDAAVYNFILSTLCSGESPEVSPLEAERTPPPGLAP